MEKQIAGIPFFNQSVYPTQTGEVGYLHTGAFQGKSKRCNYASVEMLKRNPEYPTHLLSMLDVRSGTATDIVKRFGFKAPVIPKLKLAKPLTAGSKHGRSTMIVATTRGIIPGMTFTVFPIGESYLVDSVDSDQQLTVLRFGSTQSINLPAGTELLYSGNSQPENGTRTLSTFTTDEEMQVHTQIFRNSWSYSNSMRQLMQNMPDKYGKVSEQPQEALNKHLFDIESWLLLGSMDAMSAGGVPHKMAPGLREYMTLASPQNIITIADDMTPEDLFTVLESFSGGNIVGAGSNNKVLYVDRKTLAVINRLGRAYNKFVFQSSADSFGRRFSEIQTDTLNFTVYHHEFLDTVGVAGGIAMVIDYSVLRLDYFRKTFPEVFHASKEGKQMSVWGETGADGAGGSWITEAMLLNFNPSAHGMIVGLNARGCTSECKM
jgi:hypothetical protein